MSSQQSLGAVYASRTFMKLLEQSKDRLMRGAHLRALIQNQIAAGIEPTGYRADFLDQTSREVIDHLCAAAEKFNQEHPDDMCSLADMLDIVATTRNKLLAGVKLVKFDPPGTSS